MPTRFAIFPVRVSKVLRLLGKSEARSFEVLHLSHKIIFPKLKIRDPKMQPLSGNQRPDLLTSLMNMSLVLRLPRNMHFCRSSSNVPRCPTPANACETSAKPHVLLTFDRLHNSLCLPRETTSERPKVVQTCGNFDRLTWKCASCHNGVHFSTSQHRKVARDRQFLRLLTSKRASRHNSVHFFDISASKRGLNMRCFVHFDFEM